MMADEENNKDGVESLLSPQDREAAKSLMRGLLGGAPKPPVDLNPDHQRTLAPDAPEPALANEAAFKIDPGAQIQPFGSAEVINFTNRQAAPSEEDREQLKAAKSFAIDALTDMMNDARANGDNDLVRKLEDMLKNVIASRDPKAVANVMASATVAVSHAAGKADDETPQQKVDRLWGELKQLNEKAKEHFEALGAYTTEADKKRRKEIEEALKTEQNPERKQALEKEIWEIDRRAAERAIESSPPGSDAERHGQKLLQLTEQREKIFKEYIEMAKKHGAKDEEIERDKKEFAKKRGSNNVALLEDDVQNYSILLGQLKREAPSTRTEQPKETVAGPIVSVALNTTEAAAAKNPGATPKAGGKPGLTLDFS